MRIASTTGLGLGLRRIKRRGMLSAAFTISIFRIRWTRNIKRLDLGRVNIGKGRNKIMDYIIMKLKIEANRKKHKDQLKNIRALVSQLETERNKKFSWFGWLKRGEQ